MNIIKLLIIKYLVKFEKAKKADFEKLLLDKLPNVLDEKQKKNKIKKYLTKTAYKRWNRNYWVWLDIV